MYSFEIFMASFFVISKSTNNGKPCLIVFLFTLKVVLEHIRF